MELDAGNRIFTTLPVMPVGRTGGGGQEAGLSFAHFANGAGIISDLVLNRPIRQGESVQNNRISDLSSGPSLG